MTTYFSKFTDQQLLDMVDEYSGEFIELNSPLRKACHDLHGDEKLESIIRTAVPLMQEISLRLKRYSPHSNLNVHGRSDS